MGFFRSALVVIIVIVVAVAAYAYSGAYNVSAIPPHGVFADWFLHTAMERSVERHAEDVEVPDLDEEALVEKGLEEYDEECVACHGAPGVEPADLAKGLRPEAPELAHEGVEEWTSGELFWIVKNGIRMTGMPAWGPTHEDRELWAIVAFMRRLPEMSASEYEGMLERHGGEEDESVSPGSGSTAGSHGH